MPSYQKLLADFHRERAAANAEIEVGVAIAKGGAAMVGERKLDGLVAKYRQAHPGTDEAAAFDAVLKTREGSAAYAESLGRAAPALTAVVAQEFMAPENAEATLDALVAKRREANPSLSEAAAFDAVLATREGGRLYAASLGRAASVAAVVAQETEAQAEGRAVLAAVETLHKAHGRAGETAGAVLTRLELAGDATARDLSRRLSAALAA